MGQTRKMVQPSSHADWSSGGKRKMRRGGAVGVGIEENILAIFDDSHDSQYSHDDRLAFLEAVRATSIVAEDRTPPTTKMFETIFQIFRTEKSLELIMASFQLLNELEQSFPRVYSDAGAASKASSTSQPELVVDEEAWSPFTLTADSERATSKGSSAKTIGPSAFHRIIQDLAAELNDTSVQPSDIRSLRNMLLFQYLVTVLEGEFLARMSIYKETMQWTIIRESTLNILLGSRRINYKGLLKDCLSVICGLHKILAGCGDGLKFSEASTEKSSKDSRTSLAIALPEVEEGTCTVMQKLMIMIMELDILKKQADIKCFTTRADGVRTPLLETILDEVTYDAGNLSTVLQVFNHPKWKLELVLQYFSKYIVKPTVRTRRRLSDSAEDATFHGTLRSLGNMNSVRSVVKKISAEAVQLLLAHGFQAHLALSSKHYQYDDISDSKAKDSSLREISEEMISAFNNLRKTDGHMEILPIAREALFVASIILSRKP
ncbi:negative regulator of systemic acquired resistance SNI1 isoform X2 [Punica granatum]|uniref:Negative regulator of systemic acquired resistance SNI1 isoform X2 n=1 Tax=Punica granatum TaxID=22663 RepID=A0A6P8CYR3_PUNGR|nr:negative regulator of systemic acquired resistance SNI1 isoform X2 [Punica granatum]